MLFTLIFGEGDAMLGTEGNQNLTRDTIKRGSFNHVIQLTLAPSIVDVYASFRYRSATQ